MSDEVLPARKRWSRLLRLGAWIIGALVLTGVGYFAVQSGVLPFLPGNRSAPAAVTGQIQFQRNNQADEPAEGEMSTVALRPASEGIGSVSAAGNLEFAGQQQVVVEVAGIVRSIPVAVGDTVEAGDLLVTLDAREAEEAVQQALLSLALAQMDWDQLMTGASADEIAAAEASLRAAEANLTTVMAGPSQQEINAARSVLAAAQAAYNDLQSGPSQAELTQLSADLRRTEVALAQAQSNYDAIAWQNSAGMSSQAAELQTATIDYQTAQAAYEEATAPASNTDLQTALSNIQSAQQTLDDLLDQPNPADIASSEAEVANARSSLQELIGGSDAATVESARVALAQAQLDVQSAARDLANTELRATTNGTVLSIDLAMGQQASAGTVALTLVDTENIQLTVNVAEMDVGQLSVGMPAEITVDALPGRSFTGQVLRIAPASDPDQSVVNYPTTILLTDEDRSGLRAGMTAVATMESQSLADAWLAPISAVEEVDGVSHVTVVRDGAQVQVEVTTGMVQGEWIIVESPELRANDQVVGSLASFVDQEQNSFGPGGGGGPAIRGGPGGGGPSGGQP